MRLINRRVHSRRTIQLEAQLITSRGVSPALLEDLSENGAKLSLARSLDPEEGVVVRWACYAAIARVAWVDGRECGLEFDRRLDTRVVAATQAAAKTGSDRANTE